MRTKKTVSPKTVRIMANGERQIEAKIGMKVRWVSRENESFAGEIIDTHGYDHDETSQFREVLHVRCTDGEIRKPIVNNWPVYLDD